MSTRKSYDNENSAHRRTYEVSKESRFLPDYIISEERYNELPFVLKYVYWNLMYNITEPRAINWLLMKVGISYKGINSFLSNPRMYGFASKLISFYIEEYGYIDSREEREFIYEKEWTDFTRKGLQEPDSKVNSSVAD